MTPTGGRSPDGERRIRRELFARLVDPPAGGMDGAGQDQRLSLGPACGKSPLEEELSARCFAACAGIWK